MTYAVGSLVKARGREWVVLPESEKDFLMLRPLGGTDDEITGILTALEEVKPASFALPSSEDLGDYRSCRLLRDAVRLGFRASSGPFRSFAQIAVEPRPYQLVPLLMALRLDPIRLLIADDVGIGKTVEACLIARELIDRGEIQSIAILCPPHLAEQWQTELAEKFHLYFELVLASTARRLEQRCGINQSIFEIYPYTIVSTDYIKSDRRRDDFIRACPDLVIVDEAHTCAFAEEGRGGRHQRFQLLKGISQKPDRHIILVTATPHSGKEDAFRSLLRFLKDDFYTLPDDLSGQAGEQHRRSIAQHFIQRRRIDIRDYMDEVTTFPTRLEKEETYVLSPEYRRVFDRVLAYAREIVRNPATSMIQQRVRWWSALALLRSMASSPAAAAATLRNRAVIQDEESRSEVDEMGRRAVMDLDCDEGAEVLDTAPGGDASAYTSDETRTRSWLLEMARDAEKTKGEKDRKLQTIIPMIKDLINDGFHPIVFCRFIPTANYLAEELRKKLPGVDVQAVTGELPHSDREARVEQLAEHDKRLLVCTDCLSEGINLQEQFDSVIHYDLSWNPTRHEQREGRIDRFGQPKDEIRVVTYYGKDTQIDGIVLDVLIRKHKTIKSSLGISVPVPVDSDKIVEAVFEGLLLKEKQGKSAAEQLLLFEDYFKPQKSQLFKDWENVSEREKRSRTMYAQRTIKVEEVAVELQAARQAIGSGTNLAEFIEQALHSHGAFIDKKPDGRLKVGLAEVPRALRDLLPCGDTFTARLSLPVTEKEIYLNRTHPIVEGLASHIMETALDTQLVGVARRSGVMSTSMVSRRTTVLLVRFRFHIIKTKGVKQNLLAEDCQVIGFIGAPEDAQWLSSEEVEKLLTARPDSNTPPDIARHHLKRILDGFGAIVPKIEEIADIRGKELLDAHRRVRQAVQLKGTDVRVEPQLPADILGVYLYMPFQGGN